MNHLKSSISWFLSGMLDSKKASEDLVRVKTMVDFKAKLKEYSEMVLKNGKLSNWQLGDIQEMALEG
ncbi:hypothetical protein E3V55_08020 [Candidatus Marinimicrobia bacterium MT.SAG.3]|nr:hypothetical protein E3V55_08020 [Candidatus Marinimicrobia bacterium MT.SAG.3]